MTEAALQYDQEKLDAAASWLGLMLVVGFGSRISGDVPQAERSDLDVSVLVHEYNERCPPGDEPEVPPALFAHPDMREKTIGAARGCRTLDFFRSALREHRQRKSPMIVVLLAGDGRGLLELTPLYAELVEAGLTARIVYAGGEVDARTRGGALRELGGPPPDLTLGVEDNTDPAAAAKVVETFTDYLNDQRPDALVAAGDTDVVMSCCLAAAKEGVPLARLDAGRRGDTSSSREVNHVIIDRIATYHFVSEPEAMSDLLAEGAPKTQAYFVGNLLTDVFRRLQDPVRSSRMLSAFHLKGQPYAAVYLDRHRSEPVAALELLQNVADHIQVLHLVDSTRTTAKPEAPLPEVPGIRQIDTESMRELLILLEHARLIITDADMIQEAAAYFEVPCLTVGRPIARRVMVTAGCNHAAPFDPLAAADRAVELLAPESGCACPPLWDGEVAGRIVDILVRGYGDRLARWISESFVASHQVRKEAVT